MADYRMKCSACGAILAEDCSPENLHHYHAHFHVCPARQDEREVNVSSQIASVLWKDLGDSTYLVCNHGDDIDQNHWHVAKDGTILSIKEGGSYLYNRRQIRRNIREVTGIDLPLRWR